MHEADAAMSSTTDRWEDETRCCLTYSDVFSLRDDRGVKCFLCEGFPMHPARREKRLAVCSVRDAYKAFLDF